MPLYEYKCDDCGNEFEELIYNDREILCPRCKSKNTQKKLSLFASKSNSRSANSCNQFI